MTMSMPAPVGPNGRRGHVVLPAQKVRRGLIPMRVGASFIVTVQGPAGPQQISCVARDPEDVPGVKTEVMCLHEKCEGKRWPTVTAMQQGHPLSKADMEHRQESHVYGLWSDQPMDPEALVPLQRDVDAAKKKLAGIDPDEKPDLHKRVSDRLAKTEGELAAAKAVIGLIAPPDARDE